MILRRMDCSFDNYGIGCFNYAAQYWFAIKATLRQQIYRRQVEVAYFHKQCTKRLCNAENVKC